MTDSRPTARIAGRTVGGGSQPFFFTGPCVLESLELSLRIAETLRGLASEKGIETLVFKASFDKANRSSIHSGRGPGLDVGLEWLAAVKERTGLPVLTDVHQPEQCARAAEVCDVLQIPAFLCRQTDLLVAAAETGKTVSVKKGQFLAPWDMKNVVNKLREAGAEDVLVTERGTSFGYGRLVVDMTGFPHLAESGAPVVFDATHSVQQPGALGATTGGDRSLVPALARAAAATGQIDGFFFEVHPDPDTSPSDGPNMVRLEDFPEVLDGVLRVHAAVR